MHKLLPPEQLDPAAARDLALGDAATRNDAQPRDLDGGDHLHGALANLPVGWLAHALGGALDVFGQLVDDVVVANLDLGSLGGRLLRRSRLEVEAHDDRVGDAGQQEVRVADGAHALADDLDRDHRVFDLLQRAEERLEGALRVGLDHKAELLDLTFLRAARELLEGDARGDVPCRFRCPALGQLRQRDLARGLLGADHLEDVARLWHLAHAGHDHRRRGRSLGDALSAVVGEGTYTTVYVAAHEVIADLESSSLHEHGGHRPSAPLEMRVDHRPDGIPIRVGLELEDVG